MDTECYSPPWLLLLAQLPSRPSSARVALWRRMRGVGATPVVNGAWVLPDAELHAKFFEQSREIIVEQGGTAFVLNFSASSPNANDSIVRLFQADRAKEYDEFAERCAALLNEMGRESEAEKYTFAEMEESEQDLEKLARWLAKIQARDFFPDEHGQRSVALLESCRSALERFSRAVYAAEGLEDQQDNARGDQDPVGLVTGYRRVLPEALAHGSPVLTAEGAGAGTTLRWWMM
jgi:hypothetical protein